MNTEPELSGSCSFPWAEVPEKKKKKMHLSHSEMACGILRLQRNLRLTLHKGVKINPEDSGTQFTQVKSEKFDLNGLMFVTHVLSTKH